MNVKELIEKLSLEDPNMQVVVNAYECGYDALEEVVVVKMVQNFNRGEKYWEGEFDEVYGDTLSSEVESALLLPRKN